MVTKANEKSGPKLLVKVEFGFITPSKAISVECLWVELLGVDARGMITGYLRNAPVMILGKWGQLVRFDAKQIIAYGGTIGH